MTALSIVVPCFNEQACLQTLHARLTAAAHQSVGGDYEMVLVNDGSRDGSWPIMRQLAAEDPHVVAVNLSRNHGHQLALLRDRHPRLFAERSANRRRSAAPLRCKLLFPLIDRLPLGDYTKQRLFRLVNRPAAALRARL